MPGNGKGRPRQAGPRDRTAAKQSTQEQRKRNLVAVPPPTPVRAREFIELKVFALRELVEDLDRIVASTGELPPNLVILILDKVRVIAAELPPSTYLDPPSA